MTVSRLVSFLAGTRLLLAVLLLLLASGWAMDTAAAGGGKEILAVSVRLPLEYDPLLLLPAAPLPLEKGAGAAVMFLRAFAVGELMCRSATNVLRRVIQQALR
jgi:hypothetical protein